MECTSQKKEKAIGKERKPESIPELRSFLDISAKSCNSTIEETQEMELGQRAVKGT